MLIKQKLWINTAILVVSMLFMLGLITYSVSSLENDIQINNQIAEVDVLVLQLRRNEKDFLARKQLKYFDKYQQNFTKLTVTIDELDESFRAINQEHVEFEQLRSTLIEYKQHFESIVKVQQDIGLHPKDGLYGQLRAAVHQVERFIADNNFQLLSDMLQLRRNEKDFMLRLDEKYLLKWQDNANLFINHVNASGYEAVIKQQINDSLASYQLAFSNLVKAQKKLGLTPNKGLSGQMRSAVHKVDDVMRVLMIKSEQSVKSHIKFVDISAYALFFSVLVIAFIVTLYISRSILYGINQLRNTMNDIAESKNLSIRCWSDSNDEIGEMAGVFNVMVASFKNLIIQVNQSANMVNDASLFLSDNIQSSNQGVNLQIQQTDLVATAVTQMVATVDEIANNTTEAANKAQTTHYNAEKGKSGVDTTIIHIEQLSAKLLASESVVNELAKDSDTIGSVLDVIRGIAEQTNLLALNAAIEAARAGEQGRGFAVVADEVRTLASRTQDSTQEIETIISSLQTRTKQIVAHMADCRIQGQNSAVQASSAGQMLEEITTDVSKIMEMNTAIAYSIKEQSSVASEVNQYVLMIRDVAGQTGKSATENKQTSEELSLQANILNKEVNSFSV